MGFALGLVGDLSAIAPPAVLGNVKVVAHRGGSKDTPESTKAAFDHCVDLGVDVIDMDVQRTTDGEFVISHDNSLQSMRWPDIKKLRVGRPPYPDEGVPLLRDVLKEYGGQIGLSIEMKIDAFETKELVDLFSNSGFESLDIIVRASTQRLKELRDNQNYPSARIRGSMSLFGWGLGDSLKNLKPDVMTVSGFWWKFQYSRGRLKKIRDSGSMCYVNANGDEQIRRAIADGAHFVVTDDPARALAILARRPAVK
jgi:glycerophosphoryl diester phosphodiesterase